MSVTFSALPRTPKKTVFCWHRQFFFFYVFRYVYQKIQNGLKHKFLITRFFFTKYIFSVSEYSTSLSLFKKKTPICSRMLRLLTCPQLIFFLRLPLVWLIFNTLRDVSIRRRQGTLYCSDDPYEKVATLTQTFTIRLKSRSRCPTLFLFYSDDIEYIKKKNII